MRLRDRGAAEISAVENVMTTRHLSNTAILLAGFIALCSSPIETASAADFSVLHSFSGSDGADPWTAPASDVAGNLYGTTSGGEGNGIVYKLAPDGTLTVLHVFAGGSDGILPAGDVIIDSSGNIFGTTVDGGNACAESQGCGTVYEISAGGTETVLHAFAGGLDGSGPDASLFMDRHGNLYGTTTAGGTNGCGTVFKLSPSGVETILFAFHGSDGASPDSSLVPDKQGNLYGTTLGGGAGNKGVVFKLTRDGTQTVLHEFSGPDGSLPAAGVVMDRDGNLYGSTITGGAFNLGVAFKLTPDGTQSVLHSFGAAGDCSEPRGDQIVDKHGDIYGTAFAGRPFSGCVYKLSPDGSEDILHKFKRRGTTGAGPLSGLRAGKSGYYYGTTRYSGASDVGVVFAIKR